MKEWIQELEAQPWSNTRKSNDQPAFNWALKRTAAQVSSGHLPVIAFPAFYEPPFNHCILEGHAILMPLLKLKC